MNNGSLRGEKTGRIFAPLELTSYFLAFEATNCSMESTLLRFS